MLNFIFVAAGIALLATGGEALIRGSLAAAHRLRISPLLSGLLIVGFGTSAPELVVSVDAAMNQQPDIAIGNVVGSNIGNILLILGLCAIISKLEVHPTALRRDASAALLAGLFFLLLAADGALGKLDGLLLLLALTVYLVSTYLGERNSEQESAAMHKAESDEVVVLPLGWMTTALAVIGGLTCLIIGSRLLLTGVVAIATQLSIPQAVIGLTVVSVGTSLPEMTVSILAAVRGHADVAVGNILGSNLFNILGILGVSSLAQTLVLNPRILQFDVWVMLAATVLLITLLLLRRHLARIEGITLLAGYIAYVTISFMMG